MNFSKRKNYNLFLLIIFSSFFPLTVYGQSFANESNPRSFLLSDILNYLKKEKQVTFLYEPETIEGVLIDTEFDVKSDVKIILKKILPPVGLKFRKVGKRNFIIKKSKKYKKRKQPKVNKKPIFLKKGPDLDLKKINGTVKSEDDDEVLFGATVRLKKSDIGTTTDENGNFSLEIPAGDQTLVYSYIGFEEKEVKVKGQAKQTISLSSSSTNLNEIIITAVGIEANKRTIGYAADNIDIDVLSRNGEANLVSSLGGKSAGVWVNTASGMPGASASIFIRGLRSVNGSNKPLFILDGIPIDNSTFGNGTGSVDVSNRMIDLNQHDIEKVTILKGASATSLYGIRAANGAIIMTSKKGGQGKPKINFSSSWGMNQVNKLPSRQNTFAQGKFKDGQAKYFGPESNINSSYGPAISDLEFDGATDYPFDVNGNLVPKGQGNGTPAKFYDAYDAFFVNGQALDNHLSVAGGTNWFDYYLSFGQFRETGIVPNSLFERYSIRGAFQVKLHEKFKLGMSSNLVRSTGDRIKRGSLFSGVPLGLFRNPITFDIGNGKTGNEAANTPETYIFENGKQRAYRENGNYDNPFWSVNRNPFQDQVNRLIQNVNFDYKINSWLKASYKLGLDIYTDKRKSSYDINSGTHRNGRITLFNIEANNVNSDFLLRMEKQVSTNWFFQTSVGHNYYFSKFKLDETVGKEFEKQGVFNISNAIDIMTDEDVLTKKVAGVFADIHWRYKNILYLNFTGRNDWSSTLPINNNRFFYPSANVGLEFTEWLGWTDSPYLSYGKIRFSIAQVGNDAGTYLTKTYFRPAIVNGDDLLPNIDFPAFGVSAFERSGILGNPNLKPETTQALEVGTDLRWLKGRIQLDISWYKSINKDQIINTQISATSGFLNVPKNAGTIENKGVEAILKINPIQKKNFNWDVSANFSKLNSTVTHLPENNSGIVLASFTNVSSMILEGQPYGVLVGTSIKRDAEGRQIIDADGFPKVNEKQTVIGDPNPDWLLGLNNTFTWENFTLSSLLDIRKGGDIWNGTRGVMSFLGVSKISGDERNVTDYIFEGVTESGEINTQPVDFANPENGMGSIYWRRYGFIGLAEDHIEDGSWVRLRELSLGYHFNPNWLGKNKPKMSISLHGHNVFLITKYSGVDPETNLRGDSNILGWDYFTMPSSKGWSIKLNATF